ncbi:MAG: murein biosynthesis integral membrane protein MurJ [Desulfobacterales bacterium]|nr:MAG: murein biosynthesis integral membrane protein MurJ [Desulfobacterales bacterium]
MSEQTQIFKAAGVVGGATLLSRILGFLRDAVIAWFFGAGFYTDAFIAAFRIPNLLRRLFAEGALSSAFVPVFTEYLVHQGADEAHRLARSALRLLALILVTLSFAGILLAPQIVRVIAPGFVASAGKFALTVRLTRVLFPYIFFIGLTALCMGILNALGHFAAPALAPAFLNLAMISSVFLISPFMDEPIMGLALGVLMGGGLQLAFQFPFLFKKGLVFRRKTPRWHAGLKKILNLGPPFVLGGAVYQINVLVSTFWGSLLEEGSVTYLYFADRLVQFPLGIFAIATSTAVLPSFSRQAAAQDWPALKATFIQAVKMILFITIPATVGLVVLREPIVALLFQRGEFDAEASRLTAYALLYYGIGIWAFAGVRIVTALFFALQDTRTPLNTGLLSIGANIVLGIVLMGPLAHGGLALATSLASILNLGLLLSALKMKLGSLDWRSIARSAGRTVVAAGIMGLAVWGVGLIIIPSETGKLFGLFCGLMGSIVTGIGLFSAFSLFTCSPEFISILDEAKKVMIGKK